MLKLFRKKPLSIRIVEISFAGASVCAVLSVIGHSFPSYPFWGELVFLSCAIWAAFVARKYQTLKAPRWWYIVRIAFLVLFILGGVLVIRQFQAGSNDALRNIVVLVVIGNVFLGTVMIVTRWVKRREHSTDQ